MSQEKPGVEVTSKVRWVSWGYEKPPVHSISLPPYTLSPPSTQLSPIMHPSLGLQGLSRLRVIAVHHEIHQEAGQVAHGEVDELGIPAR